MKTRYRRMLEAALWQCIQARRRKTRAPRSSLRTQCEIKTGETLLEEIILYRQRIEQAHGFAGDAVGPMPTLRATRRLGACPGWSALALDFVLLQTQHLAAP